MEPRIYYTNVFNGQLYIDGMPYQYIKNTATNKELRSAAKLKISLLDNTKFAVHLATNVVINYDFGYFQLKGGNIDTLFYNTGHGVKELREYCNNRNLFVTNKETLPDYISEHLRINGCKYYPSKIDYNNID